MLANRAFRLARAARAPKIDPYRFFGAQLGEDDAPTGEDLGALQNSFRENPDAAQAVFSSSSKLTTGLRSTINIRDRFTLQADEPKGLGGTDTAPNPVEILLGALGSCCVSVDLSADMPWHLA